ncbi:MAG: carboxypeptidase-like regulatory domain-containing protein, partial [Acidobacteriota bacterium]|nr:carboxypeptidase-like regulatory domain-containing protein [Acidobacteriota bacterium]
NPKSSPALTVSRAGFITHSSGSNPLPQVEPLEITLEPSSDIGGKIVDDNDEAIPGATVNLSRTRTMQMGGNTMMMQMMMDTTTDSAGEFLFENEEPGTVSISSSSAGFQEAKRDNLEVPKGEDLLDIKLTLTPGAILQGKVMTPDGRPAIGAEVKKVGSDDERRFMPGNPVDGSGSYRLEGLTSGTISVEATSPDYPRVVRDIQLEDGLNTLDLEFQGGQGVRGEVIDDSGKPIPDASVRLATLGSFWGGPETLSDGSGRFELPGVQSGEYRLFVSAEGYAPEPGGQTIVVEEQPIDGIQVVLDAGALIEGRIVGVAEADLPRVSVRAEGTGFGGFGGNAVDYEGRFRLEHLAPGTYDVVAKLSQSGRQARERVVLEPGQPSAQVELVFGGGLTLSGQALQSDVPIRNASIYVSSQGTNTDGDGPTDAEGRFSIDGLEAGVYRVQLQDFRSGLSYSEEVEVTSNREITLNVPSGEIVGRVTDGGDRRALAGVTVTLEAPDDAGRSPFASHTATSDIDGKFRVLDVGDGNWTLHARKKGYSAQQQQVQVQSGRGPENLRLTMDPTEGMTLETRLPNGRPPAEVDVAVMTPSGVALVRDTLATGENGRVRLTTVPPGEWDALVQAGGSATTRVRAQSSGATTAVSLQPACELEVVIPELGPGGAPATMTITDSRGQPYRALGWGAQPRSEWTLYSGRGRLRQLPPGSWTVQVRSGDSSWQGQATTTPGQPTTLTLE